MKITAEMLKSDDPSQFELKFGDNMTQAYLTMEDWKIMCQALYNYNQLLTVLVHDMDVLEQEHAVLKKKVSDMERKKSEKL